MNTSELINQLAARHNITKELSKDILHDMLHLIVSTAASGEDVSIAGFGKFKVTNRPARQGRNPSTGDVINIPASRKFGFTTAKAVRDELNGTNTKAAPAASPKKKK